MSTTTTAPEQTEVEAPAEEWKGQNVPRKEDRRLVQGQGVFVDDVKRLAGPTLSHRLILQPQARLKDLAATTVIAEVLGSVPVELSQTAART